MATVKRFEDLDCWKEVRELVRQVNKLTSLGKFEKDFGLKDQIRRAAVSTL